MKTENTMRISEAAKKYIGQKELAGNVFNPDTEFGKKLHDAGQKDGDPWCALFGEVVAKESDAANFALYDKLFSASAVQTFKNFEKAGFKILVLPQADTIAVWQKFSGGAAQWQGHLGICTGSAEGGRKYFTVEGNTNAAGGREGIEVAAKIRYLDYGNRNGLRLLGFIKI